MKIQGYIKKVGAWYAVEIPLLLISTQGRNRKDAYEMAKDAVETVVNQKKFRASIEVGEGNEFFVTGSDTGTIMSTVLRQQRGISGLSIREVAKRMGSNSPRAYSAYESGAKVPSLDKFTQLLQAIDESTEPVITLHRKRA